MSDDQTNLSELKLSVQRALIGEVTANLAGLQAKLDGTHIVLLAFFFNVPSEDDLDHLEIATTYVIADFNSPHTIETKTQLLPNEKITSLADWSFLRADAIKRTAQTRETEHVQDVHLTR